MARKKLEKVPVYLRAQSRAAGLISIDPNLDLANGNTLEGYNKQISKYRDLLRDYNTALSTVDGIYNQSIAQIEVLKDWNTRMLNGVASKWGKNSDQYEMAGGKRSSERKRPPSRPKKA